MHAWRASLTTFCARRLACAHTDNPPHPARSRRGATLLYLSSLAATLGCVFLLHSAILTATAIMFQLAAMAWHGVSYLPFGPRTLRFCTRSAFRLLPF